jgi:Domain of unknown function (DUF1848).
MILSVSRRTDIPAFYCDWFFNRLKEGYAYVRNPMNFHQVSKISLSKDVVDCIVFWTKDPSKIIEKLDQLDGLGYRYYFQITINGYPREIEKSVPNLENAINSFINLSKKIGKEKVIWRYDPVILSETLSINYHVERFGSIAKKLHSYTERCVFSFLDIYSRTRKRLVDVGLKEISKEDMEIIAERFSTIARQYNLELVTCSEEINLENYGIKHGKCIDDELFMKIFKIPLDVKKDKTQRKECGCVTSIDIGSYNTCSHGCQYCYANFNEGLKNKNILMHDPNSPFLFGGGEVGDKVTKRKMKSFIKNENPY